MFSNMHPYKTTNKLSISAVVDTIVRLNDNDKFHNFIFWKRHLKIAVMKMK